MLTTVTNSEGTYMLLDKEEIIGLVMKRGEVWEGPIKKIVLPLLDPDKTAVDVGAHIGCWTVPLARHCRYVYAIEAQPIMVNILLNNLQINGVHNVMVMNEIACHQGGMTASIGKTIPDGYSRGKEMDYDKIGNFGGMPVGKGDYPVPTMKLDELNLTDVQFIKVDIEGCEPLFFEGAQETIRRCRPIILFEKNDKTVSPEMREVLHVPPGKLFDIIKFCHSLGYKPPKLVAKYDWLLVPS